MSIVRDLDAVLLLFVLAGLVARFAASVHAGWHQADNVDLDQRLHDAEAPDDR